MLLFDYIRTGPSKILSLIALSVFLTTCSVDEGNQFESAKSPKKNKTIITDVLDPSDDNTDDDNTDDSTDSEINEYTEIPQYVSLTINFGEPQNSSARSMARTAIGTFEEIEALYVNAQRQGKNSFLYISPGRPLTKLNDGSWTGTLDGFIVNENYTFSISAMNLSGVLIFTGQTTHTIVGGGGNNSLNVTLNPVLNDKEITVPVITQVKLKETVGKNDNTTVITTVENLDNGTLSWIYEPYKVGSFGFANPCIPACGNFTPQASISVTGQDNVTYNNGKYVHEISSLYNAPDNVSEQKLRVIVSNKSGIGVESRFSIKVTGPVDSGIITSASPSILSITAFRIQDNTSCPTYDCLALEALVDDDGPFSALNATWSYSAGNKSFTDNASVVSTTDTTQGRFRTILKGYQDSDTGEVSLTITDGGGLQGLLKLPLTANVYPLVPVCDSSGNDCVFPEIQNSWRDNPIFFVVDIGGSAPSSIDIAGSAPSSRSSRFLGTFDEIDRLTLDLDRNYGDRRVVQGKEMKKDNQTSKWTGFIDDLIVGFDYTIIGHAYKTMDNGSRIEIFRAETQHNVTEGTNYVTLRLSPILDNRNLTVPRITRIERPFQMVASTSDNITVEIDASGSESAIDGKLSFRFRSVDNDSLPLDNITGGSFSPAEGIIIISGSSYPEIKTVFTAPDTDNVSVMKLQVRVANELEIGVTSHFNVYVTDDIETQHKIDTNPVITNIKADRLLNGDLKWTINVSNDDGFNELNVKWEYLFGDNRTFKDFFSTPSASDNYSGSIEATMSGYKDSDNGLLLVTVCEDGGSAGIPYDCAFMNEASTSISMEFIPFSYPLKPDSIAVIITGGPELSFFAERYKNSVSYDDFVSNKNDWINKVYNRYWLWADDYLGDVYGGNCKEIIDFKYHGVCNYIIFSDEIYRVLLYDFSDYIWKSENINEDTFNITTKHIRSETFSSTTYGIGQQNNIYALNPYNPYSWYTRESQSALEDPDYWKGKLIDDSESKNYIGYVNKEICENYTRPLSKSLMFWTSVFDMCKEGLHNNEYATDNLTVFGFKVKSDLDNYSVTDNETSELNIKSTTPADNATSVALDSTISVTFSQPMDVTSVTTNVANTTCSGTFQVSSDNFSTCVQMSASPSNSNSGKTFTVDPADNLSYSTTYKLKITTEAKDSDGNPLTSDYIHKIGFIIQELYTSWSGIKQFGSNKDEIGWGNGIDSNGNIYITGPTSGVIQSNYNFGGKDIFLAKFNNYGVLVWVRQLGSNNDDIGRKLVIDSNNNIYLVGISSGDFDGNQNLGVKDIVIVKYNDIGIKQWSKQIGTSFEDYGIDIDIDLENNIYILGHSNGNFDNNINNGGQDIIVLKYNSDGIKQWSKQIGTSSEDNGYGISLSIANNVYITGYTNGNFDNNINNGGQDVIILKFNSDGIKQWSKQLGTSSDEGGYGIATDSFENVYVVGETKGSMSNNYPNLGYDDIFITKYNSSGYKEWLVQTGSTSIDYGNRIDVGGDNFIYITGSTKGGDNNFGEHDVYLKKFDSNGINLWSHQFGSQFNDIGSEVVVSESGEIYVSGYTDGNLDGNITKGLSDAYIVKYNSIGEIQ